VSGQKMRPPFYRLHALTLNPRTSQDDLAAAIQACEAFPDRHRLAEGAVFAAACRRWLLDTGARWHEADEATAIWGSESDHRGRIAGTSWRCSCGASGASEDPAAAHAAHHAAATAPGGHGFGTDSDCVCGRNFTTVRGLREHLTKARVAAC